MVSQVTRQCIVGIELVLAQAADSPQTMLQRLSPLNQLRVIMGLFVVVMLGLVLFIVIKAGAHMVQGMSAPADRLRGDSLPAQDDWASKPLNETYTPDGHAEPEPPHGTANDHDDG